MKSSWVTILQGVDVSIFPLIFAWALQQTNSAALMRCELLIFYSAGQ